MAKEEMTPAVPKADETAKMSSDQAKTAGANAENEKRSAAENEKQKSAADMENKDNGQTEEDSEEKKDSVIDKGKKALGAKLALSTAGAAVKGAVAGAIMQAVSNLINAILQIATMIAQLIGVTIAVALGGLAVVALIVVIAIVSYFTSGSGNTAKKDSIQKTCEVYVSKGATANSHNNMDVSAAKLQNARRIYTVLNYYGLRPEQCFAVLGNWEHEAGLDPTAVETVFDEPFRIGESKQEAIEYDFKIAMFKPSYAKTYSNIFKCGIGLGQWTDLQSDQKQQGRNSKLLTYAYYAGHEGHDVGKKLNAQWYDLNIQLAYALDTSALGDSGAAWFESFADIGEEEFVGDKESYNKYFDPVYPIEGPNGEHEEDDYYNDEDRETARREADLQANTAEDNGDFDVKIYDDAEHTTWHWEVSKDLYNEFWKRIYRKELYRETTKRYTRQFMEEWEGIDMAYVARETNALKWFDEWWNASVLTEPNLDAEDADKFFKVEEGYASSVLKVMDDTRNEKEALKKYLEVYDYDDDMKNCTRIVYKSNRSLAEAACAFAVRDRATSYSAMTKNYQYLSGVVMGEGTPLKSCDRTMCLAARWSGYDDDYPLGNTLTQIQYLVTSPRWTEIDWGGNKDNLQPGDILIKKDSKAGSALEEDPDGGDVHHTLMYVGTDLTKQYHAVSETACVVHGSFDERYPAMDEWSSSFEEYHAFRCTSPMEVGKSQYTVYGTMDYEEVGG